MSVLSNYSDDELFTIMDADVEAEIRSRGYEFGWHKREQYAGVIYILVNPAFPKLIKIGYSDDISQRLKTLNSNSGLPDPYHVYATYAVKKRLEDLKLHRLIDTLNPSLRHAKNKEFYEMTPEAAFDLLSAIAEINGNEDLLVRNPLRDDFFDVERSLPQKSESKPSGIKRQPPFNFADFGIAVGEKLEFWDARAQKSRSDIVAKVHDSRTIDCDGVITSLSEKAREVMGLKNSPRGTEYWTWNGRRLIDMYTERYPKQKARKKQS